MKNTKAKINFSDYIKNNRDKIKKAAEANTTRNKDGHAVLEKNDPWREEKEWDSFYKEVSVI